jgi:hypothetical protein
MKPTKIADGVYDVGVIDWNIRDFHGYSTDRGTSYNAYLVVDEKVALIDTVKAPFADQLIGNISQIIDPRKNRRGHQQPYRDGPLRFAAAHHASGGGRQTPLLLQNGGQEPGQPLPQRMELSSRQRGRRPVIGQAHPHLHGNPHDPLAGQHVYLFERGSHPLFQRRIRPALCGIRKIRRPGRRRSHGAGQKILCQHPFALCAAHPQADRERWWPRASRST